MDARALASVILNTTSSFHTFHTHQSVPVVSHLSFPLSPCLSAVHPGHCAVGRVAAAAAAHCSTLLTWCALAAILVVVFQSRLNLGFFSTGSPFSFSSSSLGGSSSPLTCFSCSKVPSSVFPFLKYQVPGPLGLLLAKLPWKYRPFG